MPNYTLIDPKVDFAFKRLFGSSIHPAPLLDFINAVLDAFNEPPVSAITVLNPVLSPEQLNNKSPNPYLENPKM